MTKKITIKEAIEQGYEYCGHENEDGQLTSLEFMDEKSLKSMIEQYGKIFLSSKKCLVEKMMTASDVLAVIDEEIERHELGLEAVSEILGKYEKDLQLLLDKMEAEIRENHATCTYGMTDIQLIPQN